jgi:hypothetical protein
VEAICSVEPAIGVNRCDIVWVFHPSWQKGRGPDLLDRQIVPSFAAQPFLEILRPTMRSNFTRCNLLKKFGQFCLENDLLNATLWPMNKWLKSIGRGTEPVPEDWFMSDTREKSFLDRVWFPKHPKSVRPGDLLVYYAAGRRCVCAVVIVDSEPKTDDADGTERSASNRRRWRWWTSVKPIAVIRADGHAPDLEKLGFNPLRVRRQSHVRLTDEEFGKMGREIANSGLVATGLA